MERLGLVISVLLTCLVSAPRLPAQGKIITFDAPGVGTGPGEGTFPQQNNKFGVVVGGYIDSSGLKHGFLRGREITIAALRVIVPTAC